MKLELTKGAVAPSYGQDSFWVKSCPLFMTVNKEQIRSLRLFTPVAAGAFEHYQLGHVDSARLLGVINERTRTKMRFNKEHEWDVPFVLADLPTKPASSNLCTHISTHQSHLAPFAGQLAYTGQRHNERKFENGNFIQPSENVPFSTIYSRKMRKTFLVKSNALYDFITFL